MKANSMKSYRRDQLKREALEAAKRRGHEMKRFSNHSPSVAMADCRVCGASIYVNACPMPNDIDIAGAAVALNCPAEERC